MFFDALKNLILAGLNWVLYNKHKRVFFPFLSFTIHLFLSVRLWESHQIKWDLVLRASSNREWLQQCKEWGRSRVLWTRTDAETIRRSDLRLKCERNERSHLHRLWNTSHTTHWMISCVPLRSGASNPSDEGDINTQFIPKWTCESNTEQQFHFMTRD